MPAKKKPAMPKALRPDAKPKTPEPPKDPERVYIGDPLDGQQAALIREAYEDLVAAATRADEAKVSYQKLILMVRPEEAHGFDVGQMRFFTVKE